MLGVLYCIRDEHDVRFVFVAALICLLASFSTMFLVREARAVTGRERLRYQVWGSLAAGFGIWSTHFVAMLGYAPQVISGYRLIPTLLSMLLPVLSSGIALRMATHGESRLRFGVAGSILGAGFAAMHYLGMSAIVLPAQLRWNDAYVAASIAFAVLPAIPALIIAMTSRRPSGLALASLIMFGSVIALHFTGMAGLTLIPASPNTNSALITPRNMAETITAVVVLLGILSSLAVVVTHRARTAILAREREFSILVRGITDCAIYMLDLEGRVQSWNAGAQRLKGYERDEAIGLALETFYSPEDREAGLPARALGAAATEGRFTGEGWRMRRDGSRFWAHVTIEAVNDDAGQRIGFAKITRDMTRYKNDQDKLAESRRQLDAALSHMHQGLCLFDADERLLLRNSRFLEMYALSEDECLPGCTLTEAVIAAVGSKIGAKPTPERIEWSRQVILNSLDDPNSPATISEYEEELAVSVVSRALPDGGWVTTFDDVTHQRRSEARIAHMAMHDGLTGLGNRTRFNLWIDDNLAKASETSSKLAVIVIDLDRFKEVNDTFGHAAGDGLLIELAKRLEASVGENEVAARLGGDEFGLALVCKSDAQLAAFIDRIADVFTKSVPHRDLDLTIGASLGIAVYPHDGPNRETLLNNADLAMYRSKASIGRSISYYEPSMDESARQRRQLANDLRHAIAHDELSLLYQPQCHIRSGTLSGYEALIRWNHPQRGSISPADFIPIAEECGQIIPIGEWVLREACREAAHWPEDMRVAVNLSPIQLVQPDLTEMVMRVLLETGLSPSRLELEITESAIITDKIRALHNLRGIKALGVDIAMDDFGTGYSSLDTLHSFPFDKIKIDKSFLLQSEGNTQARAIIRAVLALGQSLKIPVLAEGVETIDQLNLLLTEGCEQAQGYYLGRPGLAPSRTEPIDVSVPEPDFDDGAEETRVA